MRRTYSDILKRITVNLDQNGADRLNEVYNRLQARFKLTDKPSLSLMMAVALKRLVDEDAGAVDGLWAELQEESQTKTVTRRSQHEISNEG